VAPKTGGTKRAPIRAKIAVLALTVTSGKLGTYNHT
jgi:hypothetical protein